jgi:DoxX-like family
MTSEITGKARGWNVTLWSAQALLAAMYAFAGYQKVMKSPQGLTDLGWTWALTISPEFIVGLGVAELLGTVGILLPAATRILPSLTLAAAAGMTVVQLSAIGLHGVRGETAQTIPLNLVLLITSLFVIWGRMQKAPLAQRRARRWSPPPGL